jgi:alpha-L-rhamnosidase
VKLVALPKTILFSFFLMIYGINSFAGTPVIADLRCEFLREPLGIDDEKPALSWTIKDSKKGVSQLSYRVLVATTPSLLNQNIGDIWDSKRIDSDKSHLVIYEGMPLESRQRYFWKVEVQTKNAENKNIENCIKDMNIHYREHPVAGHITPIAL